MEPELEEQGCGRQRCGEQNRYNPDGLAAKPDDQVWELLIVRTSACTRLDPAPVQPTAATCSTTVAEINVPRVAEWPTTQNAASSLSAVKSLGPSKAPAHNILVVVVIVVIVAMTVEAMAVDAMLAHCRDTGFLPSCEDLLPNPVEVSPCTFACRVYPCLATT